MNKRFKTLTTEIDEIRGNLDSQVILLKRIEGVEAKAQDLWVLMEKSGRVVGKAPEGAGEEGTKALAATVSGLRVQLTKRLDDLKAEVAAGFELNSNALLEAKFNERLADAVTALTRQLADRLETKKAYRVMEKQQKNMFEILTFVLNQLGGQVLIPPALMAEVQQHSVLFSSNQLAGHVHMINGATAKLKNEADAQQEYFSSKSLSKPATGAFGIAKNSELFEHAKTAQFSSARKVQKQHSLNLSYGFGKPVLPGILDSDRKTSSSLKKVVPPFQETESPSPTTTIQPPLSARPMTQAFPKRPAALQSQYAMKISVNSSSSIEGPFVAGKVSLAPLTPSSRRGTSSCKTRPSLRSRRRRPVTGRATSRATRRPGPRTLR